jgi:hypothetical protein
MNGMRFRTNAAGFIFSAAQLLIKPTVFLFQIASTEAQMTKFLEPLIRSIQISSTNTWFQTYKKKTRDVVGNNLITIAKHVYIVIAAPLALQQTWQLNTDY